MVLEYPGLSRGDMYSVNVYLKAATVFVIEKKKSEKRKNRKRIKISDRSPGTFRVEPCPGALGASYLSGGTWTVPQLRLHRWVESAVCPRQEQIIPMEYSSLSIMTILLSVQIQIVHYYVPSHHLPINVYARRDCFLSTSEIRRRR